VTDRLFVVRRAFRLNNNFPAMRARRPTGFGSAAGWLMVDRLTGRVAQLSLAEFDPFYSAASWFRDYVAYCGVSDNGEKLSAVVMQLGRKKPVLKKSLEAPVRGRRRIPSATRQPGKRSRREVTFLPKHEEKLSFSIFERAWDAALDRTRSSSGAKLSGRRRTPSTRLLRVLRLPRQRRISLESSSIQRRSHSYRGASGPERAEAVEAAAAEPCRPAAERAAGWACRLAKLDLHAAICEHVDALLLHVAPDALLDVGRCRASGKTSLAHGRVRLMSH